MRHTETLSAKAATHAVAARPDGFVVTSGTSGRTYLVAPLATGGVACKCAWATRRGRLAVVCSHVLAVYAFAGEVLGKSATPCPSDSAPQGAQDLGDGVVLVVEDVEPEPPSPATPAASVQVSDAERWAA